MIKVLIADFMFYFVKHNELLVYFHSMQCVIVQFLPTWPPKVFLLQHIGTFASSAEHAGKMLLNCVQFSFRLTDKLYSLVATLWALIRNYLVHVQERTSINIFLGHHTELMDSAFWVKGKVQFKKSISILFFFLHHAASHLFKMTFQVEEFYYCYMHLWICAIGFCLSWSHLIQELSHISSHAFSCSLC